MEQTVLDKNRPVHLIGGGGVGMSGLGHLLINLGFKVSASDRQPGLYLSKLASAGAKTWTGSDPEKISSNAIVFYSTAIQSKDPERLFCEKNNIPVYPRHGLLSEITSKYYTIGISGTHGKTTTTGWVAFLFETAGISPNALVGGTITSWGSNYRKGDGKISGYPLLVIEADESDESFLYIKTREAAITNIELDHVDNYQSFDDVMQKFISFIEMCNESDGVFFPSIEMDILPFKNFEAYQKIQEIRSKIEIDTLNHCLVYNNQTEKHTYKIGLMGRHNLWNASVVLLIGLYHQFNSRVLKKALFEFNGVERRMQLLKSFKNSAGAVIDIMDDYAHHPTEIRAVLKTLIDNNEEIIAIWEPHRVSRFLHFNADFKLAFEETCSLDNLFLIDIFDAAGEKKNSEFENWQDVWKDWINSSAGLIISSENFQVLKEKVANRTKKTTVVFLGAGNSSAYARAFAGTI